MFFLFCFRMQRTPWSMRFSVMVSFSTRKNAPPKNDKTQTFSHSFPDRKRSSASSIASLGISNPASLASLMGRE